LLIFFLLEYFFHRETRMPSLSRLTRSYERAFKSHPALTLAITNGCLKCLGDFLAQFLPFFSSGQPFVLDVHRSLRFFLFGFLHGPCVGKWHEFLERRIPLKVPRGTGVAAGSAAAAAEEEEEELRLIETEKSLTNLRPVSMRSRSIAGVEHVPTLRSLTSSDAQSLPHPNPKTKPNASFRFWGLVKRILLDQLVMAPLYTFLFISLTGWFEGLTIPEIQERLHRLYWYILTSNWKIWPLIQIFNFSFMPLQYRVPWQGSCGVLWTVFLSLSTHSSAHLQSSSAGHASGATMVGSTLSRIFKARPSGLQTGPAAAGTSGPDHLRAPPDLTTNSSSSSSSSTDPSSSSSQLKRKNNRVIG